MKINLLLGITLLLSSCSQNQNTNMQEDSYTFYVGTYTSGSSEGIYKFVLNEDGSMNAGGLAAKTDNPTYMAFTADKKFLLCIGEVRGEDETGFVKSYRVMKDTLKLVSQCSSGGAHPCFVDINRQGYVLAANYGGGNVGLSYVNEAGVLSKLMYVQQHEGSGPNTGRQKAPHAHSAWFVPGSEDVLAVDLGTDDIWISGLDITNNKLIPANPQILEIPPGAGPRHLDFHPNGKWIYVVNELDGTVSHLQRNGDLSYELKSTISILPSEYSGQNKSADIHISSDGKFVYASNRGPNNIAICSVNKDGSLELVGHEGHLIDTPRNFALSPNEKFLLVANQETDNIICFERDSETGLLTFVSDVKAPTPVCIKF